MGCAFIFLCYYAKVYLKSRLEEKILLEKINGNTYLIPGAANIGVYSFKNKNCMLIDTGINSTKARRVDEELQGASLHAKYIINTHAHSDHGGGNKYFTDTYPGCEVYASEGTALYLKNPDIYPSMLYSAPSSIKSLNGTISPSKVDFMLDEGINKINDEKFEVLSTPGHCYGHIAITTPDRVCFLGDCIFSSMILEKYKLPNLVDIGAQLSTLDKLSQIDADYFVVAHAKEVYSKKGIIELIDENRKAIEMYEAQIMELLSQPYTKEGVVESIMILNEMEADFREYHIVHTTISAYLNYLYTRDRVKYSIEDGRLYYFA